LLAGVDFRMLIRLGYDIIFETPIPVPIVALLQVHPSRFSDLREPDVLTLEPFVTNRLLLRYVWK
jgi:hypothetical protein